MHERPSTSFSVRLLILSHLQKWKLTSIWKKYTIWKLYVFAFDCVPVTCSYYAPKIILAEKNLQWIQQHAKTNELSVSLNEESENAQKNTVKCKYSAHIKVGYIFGTSRIQIGWITVWIGENEHAYSAWNSHSSAYVTKAYLEWMNKIITKRRIVTVVLVHVIASKSYLHLFRIYIMLFRFASARVIAQSHIYSQPPRYIECKRCFFGRGKHLV